MAIREALLPEFDYEMANTRKSLERIPEDKLKWKPHDKSTTLGDLVTHLSYLPTWAVTTIDQEELDIEPPGGPPFRLDAVTSRQEALDRFDKSVSDGRKAISGASDEHLLKPWTLLKGGQKVLTMPRAAVLRTFVMNHLIHHRAQLGLYLRLNDVPVPPNYGPTADEEA